MRAAEARIRSAERSIADRAHHAFERIPDERLRALLVEVRSVSKRERLVYVRKGRREVVRVFAEPLVVSPAQLRYLRGALLEIHAALRRLPELYLADPQVRAVLQLPPEEEDWLRASWTPQHRKANPVYARHDAAVDYAAADWASSLQLIETNMNAVGGVHLLPAAERVLAKVTLPALRSVDPGLRLRP